MNELKHHGILGQKWGVRRYQNRDGTLTPRGKQRRRTDDRDYHRTYDRDRHRNYDQRNNYNKNSTRPDPNERLRYKLEKARLKQEYKTVKYQTKQNGKSSVEKTLAVIGAVVTTASTAIGAYHTIVKIRGDKEKLKAPKFKIPKVKPESSGSGS